MKTDRAALAIDARPEARRAAAAAAPSGDDRSPADRYAELFVAVQRGDVFDDSKTFVDCAPQQPPDAILAAYRRECPQPGFDLRDFVHRHFSVPDQPASGYHSPPGQPLAAHIDGLWEVLTRRPVEHPPNSSLLPLPHPYVVPGGRFAELYYWDSYFVMVGLVASNRDDLLHAMTDNFAYLIDTYGHVPNGNRTYYLSRSQPPLFALMAELCERCGGHHAQKYLSQMRYEHAYWMHGADTLAPGQAQHRVVMLPDGALLNRYWDDRDTPREESWREDVATAACDHRPSAVVWRDIRAAAESGWDFSSRWLPEAGSQTNSAATGAAPARTRRAGDGAPLAGICTTDILPVDLNALMYALEDAIARHSGNAGDTATADAFEAMASRRRAAIDRWLWQPAHGAWFDFDWRAGKPRRGLNAATVAPLFTGAASQAQADALADTVPRRLLAPGGLATTECASCEQWDRPNGWAPLQWMAVEGFERYGHAELADAIRARWLKTVGDLYRREGKLVEKYALRQQHHENTHGGAGGEYPLQDGFGWTNGVTRRWLDDKPEHDACVDPAPSGSATSA